MLDTAFFHKRFSVGLTLDTTIDAFEEFLARYHPYIENVYFSLPLGDKFHARENVVKQMRDPEAVKLLWNMLHMIQARGIKLELVLNNGNVTDEDVHTCKSILDEHGVQIDLVGITGDIYHSVRHVFPDQEIVYSFKNRTHTAGDFDRIADHYDQIVLGRQNIRNTALFGHIQSALHSKVVLLLNNGCSHICGGCTTLHNCHRSYYRAKFSHDAEYIYALQSIMPHEIHSGMLDLHCVDLLKISSRNASLKYLDDCLRSYIFCIEDEYIARSTNNYLLWGRLAWHAEYYDEFAPDRIRSIKQQIYSGDAVPTKESPLNLCLDLRDRYIFTSSTGQYDARECDSRIQALAKGLPYVLEECILGISNCRHLLHSISCEKLTSLLLDLKTRFAHIYFEFPPLTDADMPKVHDLLQYICAFASCIVVNDWHLATHVRNEFALPVALGEFLSFSAIQSPVNDCSADNDQHFGKGLIRPALTAQMEACGGIEFLVCDIKSGGLCISKSQSPKLLVNLLHRTVALETCTAFQSESCGYFCLQAFDAPCSHICSGEPWGIHCNSIRAFIDDFAPLEKTVYENRATFVITL